MSLEIFYIIYGMISITPIPLNSPSVPTIPPASIMFVRKRPT